MDVDSSIRSRGVGISIASFFLSSLGLILSVLTALLDICLGHDAVAYLLTLATRRQHSVDHDSPTRRKHAQRAHRARSPSPSPHAGHHHHHHHYHRHHNIEHPGKPSLKEVSNNLKSRIVSNPERPASFPQAHSPIPTITIQRAGEASSRGYDSDSIVTLSPPVSPNNQQSHQANNANSHSRRRAATSSTSKPRTPGTPGNNHTPPTPAPHTSTQNGRVHALGLTERTTSVTFLHSLSPKSKPSTLKHPLPPLGTSPAQFRQMSQSQAGRRGLPRCSSSPDLSTPPATPASFYEQQNSSVGSLLTPSAAISVHNEQRRRRKSSGDASVKLPHSTQGKANLQKDFGFLSIPPDVYYKDGWRKKKRTNGLGVESNSDTDSSLGHAAGKALRGMDLKTLAFLNSPPKNKDKKTDDSKPSSLGKILRRVPSAPVLRTSKADKSDTSTKKPFAFFTSSNSNLPSSTSSTTKQEKEVKPKRSQTGLPTVPQHKKRTQPYEAPFFCPTPDSVFITNAKAGNVSKTVRPSRSLPSSRANSPERSEKLVKIHYV
ncbi:hypothetical protein FA15DRAFT_257724 [Coprinopsis marcescibilis]|uniref:Uncharacterized protein n=1 Tax=Coprinopsis marcescibilis TaxID=230819 RepID=A0A5C3L1F8_COPMA|nr:hypothetical protein FA15DRAFT_257724 [Coprinopsis marcescibilis]